MAHLDAQWCEKQIPRGAEAHARGCSRVWASADVGFTGHKLRVGFRFNAGTIAIRTLLQINAECPRTLTGAFTFVSNPLGRFLLCHLFGFHYTSPLLLKRETYESWLDYTAHAPNINLWIARRGDR